MYKSDTRIIVLLEDLKKVSNRLYCASQALLYAPDVYEEHCIKIGTELTDIMNSVDDIIGEERLREHYMEEELKKFEQGFGYVRPEGCP